MTTKKIGTEIHFKTPKKLTFQIESSDKKFAAAIALDTAKNRYPNLNWDDCTYTTSEYTYTEIVW